jgi:hypothetical protein
MARCTNRENTMKSNLVILFSVAMLAASGYSQNSGGTGGGTTAPGQPTGPTSPGAAGTAPPSLNQSIGENSFPAKQRTQPATAPGQVVPGEIGVTNTIATETNQFGVTNLPPTSQPGFTNRVMGTNGSVLMRDQAISAGDRQLLAQIRMSVFGSSQTTATTGGTTASGGTSVHFILRDGAVRVVGFVPNAQEQNRIVTTVQKVPGVVRVFDALQVGASVAPGQAPASQAPPPGQTPGPGQPQ